MTLTISPLSDALGADVSGIDWHNGPSENELATIRKAFLEHHLLCLRSEPLVPADFAKAASYFGSPQKQLLRSRRDGDVPEVSILESTYATEADKPDDMRMVRLSGWHTDDSYLPLPAKGTVLQSLEIPNSGGETRFANTRKAYEELSEDLRDQIDGLRAVHSYDTQRAPARAITLSAVEERDTADIDHPLARTHEDTGRKAIYFNANRVDRVVGMDRKDSDALLDTISAHITQPKYQYHHSWRVGDILVWDNRCLVHSVNMDFPVGQTRRHQRILLSSGKPV